MKYYKQNNTIYAYDEQQVAIGLADDKTELTAEEFELHLNPPKTVEQIVAEYEASIQLHIDSVCQNKGYTNCDSIAKYLVNGNPFKDECEALSLWIANVWVYSYQVLQDVEDGVRPIIPTVEELIAELPEIS